MRKKKGIPKQSRLPPHTHRHINAVLKEHDAFQILRVFQNGWRDKASGSDKH